MKIFLIRFAPPLLMMGIIYYVSSLSVLPGSTVVWWDFILKKSAHMTEYALLFFLWQRALNWNKEDDKKSYWLAFLIVFLYAVSDEFHQSFTPGRHPKVTDIGFDLLGLFMVYLKQLQFI